MVILRCIAGGVGGFDDQRTTKTRSRRRRCIFVKRRASGEESSWISN